ncbi:hypothetical protein HWQ46_00795 [Shewanella sp. D64]|uniref:hypothetical protein n=1 Tax=unclassified Shewanella TaxID=196818 RepID=UPI0022BA6722|nr:MULTISPECIES: hypothetical protein [unclassified Shewanella]MEC4724086.1 hypothetical protein [Shewanella sp. D64]MEC4736106.1 hypothetical protein [Shewanella sp. E94]WBJ97950.1 hypothetical protein HWQ47_13060 [Shewanella sp. MTB7]
MNLKILLTLVFTLFIAWGIFHFKAELGLFILPLFIGLVSFVTLRLYRLMEKDE